MSIMNPYGSSPLARGLPSCTDGGTTRQWIIPARAGFTANYDLLTQVQGDHPRSRGVYTRRTLEAMLFDGSSPLARGLRYVADINDDLARIIPARAGFTGRNDNPFRRIQDHPRSRGVYQTRRSSLSRNSGSSPLARGLPDAVSDVPTQSGIIPARAGFTASPSPVSLLPPDHPRSRGVYSLSMFAGCDWQGSSPLARGLHVPWVSQGIISRIIPARAGFTLGDPWNPNDA